MGVMNGTLKNLKKIQLDAARIVTGQTKFARATKKLLKCHKILK
jgi:hypothetical protein